MIKRVMDNKGNSTVKIECDLCGSLCEKERNVAFSMGLIQSIVYIQNRVLTCASIAL